HQSPPYRGEPMTKITSDLLATMHERRLRGETCAEIARSHGIKEITVYQRLRRKYGLDIYRFADLQRQAANDNVPGRVRKMAEHNGGCSTRSGRMPGTLARVPTSDGAAPANDNVPMQRQPMQVAA